MFNEAKTAQMAAYLLSKSGGSMRYIKLMKLLYLADRKSMEKTGDSMTHDVFYALENGPILSDTLNLLRGKKQSAEWSRVVVKNGYEAKLVGSYSVDELDELSPFNMQIMDEIYAERGGMHWKALCNWTHEHCPEWKDPGKSRIKISPRDVFEAFGWSAEQAQQLASRYDERRELDRTLANFN